MTLKPEEKRELTSPLIGGVAYKLLTFGLRIRRMAGPVQRLGTPNIPQNMTRLASRTFSRFANLCINALVCKPYAWFANKATNMKTKTGLQASAHCLQMELPCLQTKFI